MRRGAGDLFRRLLQRYDLAASSGSVRLSMDAQLGDAVDFSLSVPAVADGLEKLRTLSAGTPARGARRMPEPGDDFPRVLRAYMIAQVPRVVGAPLKLSASAYVDSAELIRAACVRSAALIAIEDELKVHTTPVLPEFAAVRDATPGFHLSEPPIRDRTSRIAGQPLIRGGVDLERVDPKEREGFLHEAESTKGVACDRGELLAVFRNVPVELIAKAHYSEEKKVLLYTLETGRSPSHTRVHDLGIVRDCAAGKTHMVVHRRQFKSVQIG